MAQNFTELANFIWSVADLLRGDYKQSDYGKVTDADFLGVVTNWQGRLMTFKPLASQAKKNTKEQFLTRFEGRPHDLPNLYRGKTTAIHGLIGD